MAQSIDLDEVGAVHVVGVGGAGMSGIAAVLAAMGHAVTGTDQRHSPVFDRLAGAGVAVRVGHDPAAVAAASVLTASSAVPPTDPDVAEARRLGIPVLSRADVLAAICRRRRVVAVAGTHGKTTTSSMLATILERCGQDPSYVIGGDITGLGPGAKWGSGAWMVVEADESDGTFLRLQADVAVVTSVEPDHLEHFGGEAGLQEAFGEFVAGVSDAAVLCADDPGASRLVNDSQGQVRTYGTAESAAWRIAGPVASRAGITFRVHPPAGETVTVDLAVPGVYNARNATAALAAAEVVGVSPVDAATALATFRGVARRFEWRGERNGVTYVDDYGHLPGEVRAAIGAARAGGWRRVVAVFQPHRYSRTASLWSSFADAFDEADVVVVTDVYASGEDPLPGVSGALVGDAVRAHHPGPVHYIADLAALPAAVEAIVGPGDLCLTLGAGDLTQVVDRLVEGEAGG